jgi:hypothetical protein
VLTNGGVRRSLTDWPVFFPPPADVWSFSFTVNPVPGSSTLIAQAKDSDGVLDTYTK